MDKYEQGVMDAAFQKENSILDRWLIKKYLARKKGRVYTFFKAMENNFVTKLLEYELIGGMTTGRFQKRLANTLDEGPLEYTIWSIFFGLAVNMWKYMYAYWAYGVSAVSFTAAPVEIWGHILVAANFYRYFHVKVFREPIASPYIWPFSAFVMLRDKWIGRKG